MDASMEQILASIRKIMTEEEKQNAAQASPGTAPGGDVLELTDMVAADGSVVDVRATTGGAASNTPPAASPSNGGEDKTTLAPSAGETAPATDFGQLAATLDPNAQVLSPHLMATSPTIAPAPTGGSGAAPTAAPAAAPAAPQPAVSMPVATEVSAPAAPQSDSGSGQEALLAPDVMAAGVAAMTSFVQAARQNQASKKMGARTIEEVMQDLLRPLLSEWLNTNLHGIVEKIVSQEIQKLSRRIDDT